MKKPTKEQERWQRADEKVRKNLPPSVKLVHTLRGHTAAIGNIAWSPDGRRLASPSQDGTIRIWDCQTGTLLCSMEGRKAFRCVRFISNTLIASEGQDSSVSLWDVDSG